ncbi:hypothetical protein QNH48_15030 [Neobacillus sp. YX16]|uniref:hypothetical protein n=1 Tax=Neobacillus sp. YX16 TaxID=3047874 RepID=UPI0024C3F69A|nr:hypothetical protein [Neobacillus sp. YX16]WHZ05853.1 hypothetical protein QNH48_15030 [Neobacillus sp. YX16]
MIEESFNIDDKASKERIEFISTLTEKEKDQFIFSILSDDYLVENRYFPFEGEPDVSAPGNPKIVLYGCGATKNPRCASRCGASYCRSIEHGESFCTTDYNADIGRRGNYDIIVYIRHGQFGTDSDTWRKFTNCASARKLFRTDTLTGPQSPGRGKPFLSGNNNTSGRHTGSLAIEAFEPGTSNSVWWGIWYFNSGFGEWGDEWLRCGHDYWFLFRDA